MSGPDHVFHRWIDPADRGAVKSHHKLEATAAELASLAQWLEIPAVLSLKADLDVDRRTAQEVAVTGRFSAEVELICGVSLEPFRQTLDGPLSGHFRKPDAHDPRRAAAEEPAEIIVDLDTEEPGEWRPQGIDLGGFVAEDLSLAVPEFPRKPDAALDLTEAVLPEAKPNPFAVLSRLKTPPEGEG